MYINPSLIFLPCYGNCITSLIKSGFDTFNILIISSSRFWRDRFKQARNDKYGMPSILIIPLKSYPNLLLVTVGTVDRATASLN